MLLQVFGVLMALGSVIFLAYVTTRYFGGKTKRAMKGNYIKVVETVSLGLDKNIHLVKVGEQFILLATSGKNIEYLTTVDAGNVEEGKPEQESSNLFDFKSLFEKYVQMYKNRASGKNERKKPVKANTENEISTTDRGVFKSNLDKLRDITSKMEYKSKEDGDVDTYEK